MKPELASRWCCGFRTAVLFSSPWETKRVRETRTCASVMVHSCLYWNAPALIHPKPFYYNNIWFAAQQPADHTHLNTSWRCSQRRRKQLPCAKFRMKESAWISVYACECELNWPHLTGSWIWITDGEIYWIMNATGSRSKNPIEGELIFNTNFLMINL